MVIKIVYFGPSQGGKTTSLRYIYSRLSKGVKSEFMSINTMEDRTLFFDFFDLETSTSWGGGRIKVHFELYTVPGQVKYEETRKMVMRGADGVVFVSDSQGSKMADNLYSRADMDEIIMHHGKDPETFPVIIQYNKRDLIDILSVEELRDALNPRGNRDIATVAITGENIMEALKTICSETLKAMKKKYV